MFLFLHPSTVFWCSVQNIFTDVPEYFYRCTENKKICTKQKKYVQNRRSRYTWYKYRRSRHTGEAGKGTRRLTQRRSRLMHRRSRHSEGTTYSSTTRFIANLWNCFTVKYTYELLHVVDCTCIVYWRSSSCGIADNLQPLVTVLWVGMWWS